MTANADALSAAYVEYAQRHCDPGSSASTDGRLFVCVRNGTGLRLRVLLPAGLLVAAAGVLAALLLGWQSTLPLLAPGAVYRDGDHALQVAYAPPADGTAGSLVVRLGEQERLIQPRPGGVYAIGATSVRVAAVQPGVWLTTAPPQPDVDIATGLACEAPGQEESLLVPSVGAGLRILCGEGAPAFRVELYQSSSNAPVYAAEVMTGEQLTVPVTADWGLVVVAVPALTVAVTHFPHVWVAWLGLLFALIGLVGMIRPAAFALVQIAGLDGARSALFVQAESAATAQGIVAQLTAAAAAPQASELPEVAR